MNERIKQLAVQAGATLEKGYIELSDGQLMLSDNVELDKSNMDLEKFAELIVAEAFRAGMLYSAKKYTVVGDEQFTGNDVAMFLEMEACELSDEDIKEHFGVE